MHWNFDESTPTGKLFINKRKITLCEKLELNDILRTQCVYLYLYGLICYNISKSYYVGDEDDRENDTQTGA